jgi:hypothetical protein
MSDEYILGGALAEELERDDPTAGLSPMEAAMPKGVKLPPPPDEALPVGSDQSADQAMQSAQNDRYKLLGIPQKTDSERLVDQAQLTGQLPDDGRDELYKNYIEHSKDPMEAIAKLNIAAFLSEEKGVTFNEAMVNQEAIAADWYKEGRTPVGAWEAIQGCWESGKLYFELGNLGADVRDNGMTPELQAKIDAVKGSLPPPDRIQRLLPTTMLKLAAQSIPYSAAALAGNTAGHLAGVGVGKLAALAIPGAAVPIATLATVGRTIGGIAATSRSMGGIEYLQMIEDGMNPESARVGSIISGLLSAAIESDSVMGLLPTSAAKNSLIGIFNDAIGKGLLRGAWRNPFTQFVVRNTGRAIGEGIEEGLQAAVSATVYEAVRQASNEKDGKNIPAETWQNVANTIIENVVGGALASIPMGALGEPFSVYKDIKDANAQKAEDAKAGAAKAAAGAAAAGATAGAGAAAAGKPSAAGFSVPTPAAPLRFKETSTESDADGKIGGQMLGNADPKSKTPTVTADFTFDPDEDTLSIDKIALTKSAFKGNPAEGSAQIAAVIQEIRRKYAGAELAWDPKGGAASLVKQQLLQAFPDFFKREFDVAALDVKPAAAVKPSPMRDAFMGKLQSEGGIDLDSAESIGILLDARAKKLGFADTDAFIGKYYHSDMVSGEFSPKAQASLAKDAEAGKPQTPYGQASFWVGDQEIPGASITQQVADAKVLFHFVKKGNLSAVVHEVFGHGLVHTLTSDEKVLFEAFIGKDMPSWSTAEHEKMAEYMEKYMETGIAPTPELKGVFEKIRDYVKDIIQGFIAKYEITPEARAAYDSLFAESSKAATAADEKAEEGKPAKKKRKKKGTDALFKVEDLYHGTNRKIPGKKFSLNMRGKGEGGELAGAGGYFTKEKKVGVAYAEQLTEPTYQLDGKNLKGAGESIGLMKSAGLSKEEAIEKLRSYARSDPTYDLAADLAAERWDDIKLAPTRVLYDVAIEDPRGAERWLDLDNEVPDADIKRLLEFLEIERGPDMGKPVEGETKEKTALREWLAKFDSGNMRLKRIGRNTPYHLKAGWPLYKAIANALGDYAAASRLLDSAGYTGNTYAGDWNKNDGEPAQNYVVFNEDYIKLGEENLFKRDDDSIDHAMLGAERGTRETTDSTIVSAEEKDALKEAAAKVGLTIKALTEKVRAVKSRFPVKAGWANLTFTGMIIPKDDGSGKEIKPELGWKVIPYDFEKISDPTTVGSRVHEEVRKIFMRANAGDGVATKIIRQASWYKSMVKRLRIEYGSAGDFLADLLGATSPNTPVPTNWDFAVDVMKRASRGDFDSLVDSWVANVQESDAIGAEFQAWFDAQRQDGKTIKAIKESAEYKEKRAAYSKSRQLPDSLVPFQENGKRYGFNSGNIVRALLGNWRTIRAENAALGVSAAAPKAFNFSGNLIGYRRGATIDVWAARLIQRLSGGMRVPPVAEAGVTGSMLPSGETTLQFRFGQDALAHAAELIKADSELKADDRFADIGADDIQALAWFAEKELWTVNDWTSQAGEGGSFEFEASLAGIADRDTVTEMKRVSGSSTSTPEQKAAAIEWLAKTSRSPDRWYAGLSIQMSQETQGIDFVPSDTDQAILADRIRTALYRFPGNKDAVLSSKFHSTLGRYGQDERALDAEVSTREDFEVAPFWAEILRAAQESKQDSTFLNRVLRSDEAYDPTFHRPSIEIYFKDAKMLEESTEILKALNDQGMEYFTFAVDSRKSPQSMAGAMPAVVGLRALYIPEMDRRYGFGPFADSSAALSEQEIATIMEAKAYELQKQVEQILAKVPGITFAGVLWNETNIRFMNEYQGEIDAFAAGIQEGNAGQDNSRIWTGRSVREGLEGVDRLLGIEGAGKDGGASGQSADLPGGVQEEGIDQTPLFSTAPAVGSPEFKAWFGDSKIVDADGKPLVVYHGSDSDFESFAPEKSRYGNMMFFTPSIEYSETYGKPKAYYLRAEKVFDSTKHQELRSFILKNGEMMLTHFENNATDRWTSEYLEEIKSRMRIDGVTAGEAIYFYLENEGSFRVYEAFPDIESEIERTGYDAIEMWADNGTGRVVEYAVFSPNQVKSTNNRGTWSKEDQRLLFSQAPAVDSPEFKTWFRDSKAVNADGSPAEMFHATRTGGFQTFKRGDLGMHFGPLEQAEDIAAVSRKQLEYNYEEYAETYDGDDEPLEYDDWISETQGLDHNNEDVSIYKTYLSIQNPLRLVDQGVWNTFTLSPQLAALGLWSPEAEAQFHKIENAWGKPEDFQALLIKTIEAAGYDGIVYLNRREGKGDPAPDYDEMYVNEGFGSDKRTDAEFKKLYPDSKDSFMVFHPNQVKSVNNRGTWSKDDDRLLYSNASGRSVESVVSSFPSDLIGASDIHSQSQLPASMNVFGRGVVDPTGRDIRMGNIGSSHVGLAKGMADAKRFYYGYSKSKRAVYVVPKNGMDADFFDQPAVLKMVLSNLFDQFRLSVAPGKRLQFLDDDDGILFAGKKTQAQKDLETEAAAFSTMAEFLAVYDDVDDQDTDATKAARLAALKRAWISAHPARRQPIMTPEQATKAFLDDLKRDNFDGLKMYLDGYGALLRASKSKEPLDPVGIIATRVAEGSDPSPNALGAAYRTISSDPRKYREIGAQLTGDPQARAQLMAEEAGRAPREEVELEAPATRKDVRKIEAEIRRGIQSIDDPESRRLYAQNLVPYQQAIDAAAAAEEEVAEIRALLDETSASVNDFRAAFTFPEKKIAGIIKQVAALKKEISLAGVTARHTEKASPGSELAKAAAAKVDELKAERESLENDIRARIKALPASTAMKQVDYRARREQQKITREKLAAKIAEARAKRAAKDLAISMAKRIVAPVAKNTDWRIKKQIEAIQRTIDPRFRRKLKFGDMASLRLLFNDGSIGAILGSEMADRLVAKPLNDWTLAELKELMQKVDAMRELGKLTLATKKLSERTYREDVTERMLSDLHASGKYEPAAMNESQEFLEQNEKDKNILKKWDLSLTTMARIARELDNGKDDGWFYSTFVAKERDAYRGEAANFDRRWGAVEQRMAELGLSAVELYEGLVKIGDWTITRSEALGIYIGLQDEDTAGKIIFGNMLNQAEREDLDDLDLEVRGDENMKKAEAAVAQLTPAEKALGDFFIADGSREFSRLAEATYQYENREPKQVSVYFPNEVKGRSGEGNLLDQMREDLLDGRPRLTRGVAKGVTIDRIKIGARHQLPIALDALGVYRRGIERQEHYINYAGFIQQSRKIISNDRSAAKLRYTIRQTWGQNYLGYIDTWLTEAANPKAYTDYTKPAAGFDQAFRMMRGPLGIAYLGFRSSTAVKQLITSPIPFLPYAGGALVARMTQNLNPAEYMRALAFAKESSPFIRHRSLSPALAMIKEYARSPGITRLMKISADLSMKLIEWADAWSVVSGWTAVYEKTLAEQVAQGIDPAVAKQAAIVQADRVTIETQPTGRRADVSPVFKDQAEVTKFLTQFQGPMNVIYNQLFKDIPAEIASGHIGRAAAIASGYLATGAILAVIAAPRDDDDDKMALLRRIISGALRQPLDSIPMVGGFGGDLIEGLVTGERRFRGTQSVFPAVDRIFGGTAGMFSAKDQDELFKAFWKFAEGSGMIVGVPTSAFKEYFRAVFEQDLGALIGRPKE